MAPEHRFQLAITLIAVLPATIVSTWALINQLRQTRTKLTVHFSPMMMNTISGKEALIRELPGVLIRNFSPFPVRICSVGFRIEKEHFAFGRPVGLTRQIEWPFEMPARSRMVFYCNDRDLDGREVMAKLEEVLGEKFVWEVGSVYALTEPGEIFRSRRMSRAGQKYLRSTAPSPSPANDISAL